MRCRSCRNRSRILLFNTMGFETSKFEKPRWQSKLEKRLLFEKRLDGELVALQERLKHFEQKPETKINDVKISQTRIAIAEQQEKIQKFKESEGRIRGGDFLGED